MKVGRIVTLLFTLSPFLGDQAPSKKMQEVPDFIW
jgi:hypothetical protein